MGVLRKNYRHAAGIVGAVLGGWALSGALGQSTINQGNFSLGSLLVSFLGAIILLAVARVLARKA